MPGEARTPAAQVTYLRLEGDLRTVVNLIAEGLSTVHEITEVTGRPTNWVRWRLRSSQERGLVVQVDEDARPRQYSLTPRGESFGRHEITSLNEPI